MEKPSNRPVKDLTIQDVIQIFRYRVSQRLENLIPHSNGEWLSVLILMLGIILGLISWLYLWREYKFHRQQQHQKSY